MLQWCILLLCKSLIIFLEILPNFFVSLTVNIKIYSLFYQRDLQFGDFKYF